uniref:NADH dehydrogenase subunit 6 n=1 Tax=Pseudoglomeris montshadskii TaxID=3036343 RepID=UPI0027993FBD|nr:NADH dehydrogenase subunit 6 [Pseudoglomeris montshadskii]WGO57532.1 NADH dehydrogenase subunit 6 [Pseudoglomeris montshadskii]
MKMTLINISMMFSILFTQMNYPLALGLILLIQTVMISTITGMMSQFFWFSYTLFLVFLGGMLILFIYMTSLVSNETISMSTMMIMINFIMFLLLMLVNSSWLNMNNFESLNFLTTNNELSLLLIKIYNQPSGIITIMLAMYLFITLIAVVKITSISKGPLRQMN